MRRGVARGLLVTGAVLLAGAPDAGGSSAPTPVGVRCGSSGPLFANPVMASGAGSVTLLQSYQHGTWVGEAYDGTSHYAVVSWRPGRTRARVLGLFHYVESYGLGRNGSIDAVGVTRRGTVVAKAQAPAGSQRPLTWWGYTWTRSGQRHMLARPRGAVAVVPLAVTGHSVLGYAELHNINRPRYELVRWASARSAARVLLTLRPDAHAPVAEQNGDFAWSSPIGQAFLRLADGTIRKIGDRRARQFDASFAIGHFIWEAARRRVDVRRVGDTSPIHVDRINDSKAADVVTGGSVRGAIAYGYRGRYVRYNNGTRVTQPAKHSMGGVYDVAFRPDGAMAYLAKDRKVHLFTCTTH